MSTMLDKRHLRRSGEAVLDVLVALAQDLQIEGEHQRRTAGRLGASDQAIVEIPILHHVELKPEGLVRILRHVLDGADAHGRERERHAGGSGGACRQDLAVRVLHACEADRGEGHRHADGLPDHGAGKRAVGEVDADALAQIDALEVGLVGAVGALGPGAGVGIVVEHARHAALGKHAQVFDAGDDRLGHCDFSSRRACRALRHLPPRFPAEAGELIKACCAVPACECGFFNARRDGRTRRKDQRRSSAPACPGPAFVNQPGEGSRPPPQPNGNGAQHGPTRSATRRCARCGSAPASHANANMRTYRSDRARPARG